MGIAISTSVGLFILALVWIIIGSAINFISDEVLVGIFFIIGGLGAINLIYRLTVLPDKSNKQAKKEKRKRIHKYDDAIAVLFLIVYLLVSFITGAWYITWIIWIVYALVCEIMHIILDKDEEE